MRDQPVAPEGEPATTTGDSARPEPASEEEASRAGTADSDVPQADPAEADPFVAFASVAPEQPSRWQRILHRTGRVLGHEWTIAASISLAIAAVMTWPTLNYPR